VGEDGLVAEDAIEGGAADAELAGGAEFVAPVEVEDGLDVMVDDGVEGKVFDALRVVSRSDAGSGGTPFFPGLGSETCIAATHVLRVPGHKIGISTPAAESCG